MIQTQNDAAVVVGGTSGIGLAAARTLLERGYDVFIIGRHAPESTQLPGGRYTFLQTDLRNYDDELFDRLSKNPNVKVLLLTAGFGRVTDFENLHPSEIKALFEVNTVSTLRIIRKFYDRLLSPERLYCGVVSSIAGLVSSPMFSVYSATKAALCRFIESVNIELEERGTGNRILNIAPGSVPGTRFNGGENDLDLIRPIGIQIIEHLLQGDVLFIPHYEDIYKGVLERYHADAHAYGLESYRYKKESGRVQKEQRAQIGYLSGTFDLFHIGHLNLLRRAKAQCDYLIVGIHESGARKGKETFVPYEERVEIVRSCKYVDKVVLACPEDSDAWDIYHYGKLFVGSDYKGSERFARYEAYFADKDVEIIYFPYTKSTSSTQLRNAICEK